MPSSNEPSLFPTGARSLHEEAIAWVIRLRNEHLSAENRAAFESWYASSPAHAKVFEQVSAVWDDPDLDSAARQSARTSAATSRIKAKGIRTRWIQYGAAACVVLLVVAIHKFDLITRFQSDFYTGVGEQQSIDLPDQSLVTLNTNTAIAVSFDDAARRIRLLKGEAFFKVRSDPHRPFIVESASTATRAVGTEFVVRSDPDRDQVTVLEGRVEVTSQRERVQTQPLNAGFQVRTNADGLDNPQPVDVATISAWRRGRMVVNGAPLTDVIDEVRRYHPGTIVLWNQELGIKEVTGTFNLENPSKILALLAQTFPLRSVTLADRFIVLY